jgi:UDP-N-acetylmuramate dehydrogenase
MDFPFLKELGLSVIHNARLADHTTFKLGGPCLALVECRNAKEVTAAVISLRGRKIPFLLMGFGSNILASDHGVDKIIVRYTSSRPAITRQDDRVTVDAATQFDDLARFAIDQGLDGMTVFSGIPGTVGGAIAGNAGAYGQQISDRLLTVTLLKPDNSVITVPGSAIHFEYRDSDLKHNGDIILSATVKLTPGGNTEVMAKKREATIRTRENKHGRWQETPCAGSFFRNVEPTSKAGPRQSAGWFLEQAGCKALNVNGAHSYKNHANIIIRDDGAKAQDVYDLTLKMSSMVKEKFGLELVREVRLLGRFGHTPECPSEGYW